MRLYYKAKRTIKNIAVATRNILAFAAGIFMGCIRAVGCIFTFATLIVELIPLLTLGVFAACFLDLLSLIRQDPVPFGTELVKLRDVVGSAFRRLSHEAYSAIYKATVITFQGFKEFLNFIAKPISYFFEHEEWYDLGTGQVVYEEEINTVDYKPLQRESAPTIPGHTDAQLDTPALLLGYSGNLPIGRQLTSAQSEQFRIQREDRFPGVAYRM